MKKIQGTRRVYFKDNFLEGSFGALPSQNFASLYGSTAWAQNKNHPSGAVTYEAYNSNYFEGYFMDMPQGWSCALATQTAFKFNNTRQPYLDVVTGDGGLEPVIYEWAWAFDADVGDLTFLFYYDSATNQGYGLRHRIITPGVTHVFELYKVNNTGAPPPTFTGPLWTSNPIAWTGPSYRGPFYFRLYYTPVDVKYGGQLIAAAGKFQLFAIMGGNVADLPIRYLEGISPVAGSVEQYNFGDIYVDPSPITFGDSLGFISGPGAIGTRSTVGNVKYCRHWDYGLTSMNTLNRMTVAPGYMAFVVPKPLNTNFDTAQNGSIGYEVGDRVELYIKTRSRTFADPPVETLSHMLEFDGRVMTSKNDGGENLRNRAEIMAYDYYHTFLKWGEHFSFAPAVTLQVAFQTLTGTNPGGKYINSAINEFGIDPAVAGVAFAAAKNYKGYNASETWRRLLIFANVNSWWNPYGTLVSTVKTPSDNAWTFNQNDSVQSDMIVDVQQIQDGHEQMSNIDVHGSAGGTTTSTDPSSRDQYYEGGENYIDSREANVADRTVIGVNLLTQWKTKRNIFDVFTYQGKGNVQIGDKVVCTFPGYGVSAQDYQVIEKESWWGEKNPPTSNLIRFRVCEIIVDVPAIFWIDPDKKMLEYWRKGADGQAQHA